MGIGVIALQEIKEKVLLRFRKSTPFLGFKAMRLFQFPQDIGRRVRSEIIIVNRHIQNLMQNRMNRINRRRLQAAVICQTIIKAFHIRLFKELIRVFPNSGLTKVSYIYL